MDGDGVLNRLWILISGRALRQAVLVILIVTLSVCVVTPPAGAASKYAAVIINAYTGKILFSRNADARRYPASLAKIMTLYLLFEALENGKVTLSTP